MHDRPVKVFEGYHVQHSASRSLAKDGVIVYQGKPAQKEPRLPIRRFIAMINY